MKYLMEYEEKKLLRTVHGTKGKKAERDYMILFLGFNTGLRLMEIISLNVGDVRGKARLFVRPETTKKTISMPAGSKCAIGRTIPLSIKLQQELKRFISLKLTWREAIHDDAPLLVSKKGSRLSKRSLQEMFDVSQEQAGIEGYTVHSMRHSFAKRLIQRGVALATVQKLLGHKSLASTGIYVEAGIEEMEEAVNAR